MEESVQDERAAAAKAARDQRKPISTPEGQMANAQAEEQRFYNAAVREYESRYPETNPDSPRYDQSFVRKLTDQKISYERQGLSSTQALRRAMADFGRP